ncbi:2',3'-cyclic-nucleotide 2'-phosphodiesterase (5'-nucleotidase family) [Humitalea rosea]|uniref:2',3'-cyclic-nucleotide 2'-phosphodiesterase (5'-nucleotidase family) n=1 Tax=Humitalea rosea TaxID=990373 RepID=A0A2W7ILU0_9PROT|nr:choice-of-anchor I family protein [Humitalea rosea]PZW48017.1 2',3'-cyclic-nucleotide 2'-phosphodiesterase (5'-nucleotidase family) [Humitalea rosea]
MTTPLTSTPVWAVNNGTLAGGAAHGAEVAANLAAFGQVAILGADGIDVLSATTGALAYSIPASAILTPGGSTPAALGASNSVAVFGTTMAIATGGVERTDPGVVSFFALTADGATFIRSVQTGAVPDMAVFTPDGARLLVAIEGEPGDSYATDPQGGVAIFDVATGAMSFADFTAFDAQADALRAAGVRMPGRASTGAEANTSLPSNDLEPEYITINAAGTVAYVTLQEANAVAELDLSTGQFTRIMPLGTKDHSIAGNGFDASDRDGGPNIKTWQVSGLYQPDSIASFERDGKIYLVTANEGDTRDWGNYNEEIRVGDASYVLDPTLFPDAATLKNNANLGRLTVSKFTGDTDGDGDYDHIEVFGGRSFSIWEVTDGGLVQTYDSGDMIERLIASQFYSAFDESRSDNKGPEPESVTLAMVDGKLTAFVGLERSNAIMSFEIVSPTEVSFNGFTAKPGDVAPEVATVIPGGGGEAPRLIVANEVSFTTTAYDIAPAAAGVYRLQILHGSDFEAGLAATTRADRFAAIVDKLEDQVTNSITLSSGDNFLPGPFIAASADPAMRGPLQEFYKWLLGDSGLNLSGLREDVARTDIAILNGIGVQASVFGNHEFDLGSTFLAGALDFVAGTSGAASARVSSIGAMFPYLSANLDFSADSATRALYTSMLRDASSYATTLADLAGNNEVAAEAIDAQIAPWTTIVENGETIGVLGLTTQLLAAISSPGAIRVLDPNGDGGIDNTDELAAILQPYIDQMVAQGINKIVLLSHLQQFQVELDLATKLSGVDIIIAGGSHAVFADGDDVLRPGDTAAEGYPVFQTGADGKPVAVISTGNEYSYVGRLVVDFDANGEILTGSVEPALNGPIATTDANVAALWGAEDAYAEDTRGGEVRNLLEAVQTVIEQQDGTLTGMSKVYLEGRRTFVRTEETNLGDLSADANLWAAMKIDADVVASLKNGGGIRTEIGSVGLGAVPTTEPTLANPAAGKQAGQISQLDITNSLRFNNAISIVSVTAAEFEHLLEHAVAAAAPGVTPGQFGQFGGIAFSYDATMQAQVLGSGGAVTTEGQRVRSAVILNDDGSVRDVLVQDGAVVGAADRAIKFATLSFLADGGDSYPINFYADSRVDLLNNVTLGAGEATFAAAGSEQDILAEFLIARHAAPFFAYGQAETGQAGDARTQNLAARSEALLQTTSAGPGTQGNDLIEAGAGNSDLFASHGRDTIRGGAGHDTLTFLNMARGNGGLLANDAGQATGFAWSDAAGQNSTHFAGVEVVRFADGRIASDAADGAWQASAIQRVVFDGGDVVGTSLLVKALDNGQTLVSTIGMALLESGAVTNELSDGNFVERLYAEVLNRGSDGGGLSYWTGVAGTGGRAGVFEAFLGSAEAATVAEGMPVIVADYDATWIGRSYDVLLGRGVDQSGYGFWQTALDSNAPTALLDGLVGSVEFAAHQGALSDASFVELLYQDGLGRVSDTGGAGYWVQQLGAGTSRGAVAEAILASEEGAASFTALAYAGIELV